MPDDAADDNKPPRVKPRIVAAPKIRNIYWCDLPKDAQLPELWKVRPVIVVSYRNTLHGIVTAIATSTFPQDQNPFAVRLATEIEKGRQSWAICDKPLTIATSRLRQFHGAVLRLPEPEFHLVLARLLDWLPKLP